MSRQEQEALIAGYDNSLAFLDEEIGRLIQTLTSAPDGANTIVIITSDHGEAFGEHGLYGHGWDLHREVLHVPLIIIGPGIPSNQRIAHIVCLREIFPTVLDMALGPRKPFSRVNLRRFWTPGFTPDTFDEVVISELVSTSPDFQPAFASLMTPEWHYIHDSRGQPKLYRWPVDPNEQANLAADARHQETLRNLHALLLDHLGSSHRPWRGPEYLFALDGPGYSFLHQTTFGLRLPSGQPPISRPIGTSQAFFTPDPARPRNISPMDEELLQSLPYH
jgi:arylsulfatase A-like enzyme